MKAHRRGIPRLTWFKLAVCLCLAAMAVSLFTPYPAQIIRALKGEPVSYTHLTLPTNSRV